jgi:hypothetical protein
VENSVISRGKPCGFFGGKLQDPFPQLFHSQNTLCDTEKSQAWQGKIEISTFSTAPTTTTPTNILTILSLFLAQQRAERRAHRPHSFKIKNIKERKNEIYRT